MLFSKSKSNTTSEGMENVRMFGVRNMFPGIMSFCMLCFGDLSMYVTAAMVHTLREIGDIMDCWVMRDPSQEAWDTGMSYVPFLFMDLYMLFNST